MKKSKVGSALAMGTTVLIALAMSACATKKYVRNSVQPLETKLGTVDQKTTANAQSIKDVDRRAETGIADAASKADAADQHAGQAGKDAQTAQQTAQKGVEQASLAQQEVENADNFQPVKSASVLFKLNRSTLTDADKEQLDELAQSVTSMKHYVIQIQGFTDKTGPKRYNLALSKRRADSVVRYLSLNHNIPLVKIYEMGYGNADPTASNRTRKGREQNRRVDVKVMTPPPVEQAQQQTPNATGGAGPTQ
ncbi:MAG TPA: OmpA family protein [Terriglobia bacterium]|nr:OmpA family protein [Terriglobia bacterium]